MSRTSAGWPFHEGETRVQERAGVRELADRGRPGIRTEMPDQHRELFAKLPYLVVGALDAAGRPFATMLTGAPGFVGAPDASTLFVRARPHREDPITSALVPGAAVGVLGIELGTRRRNRANGTLGEVGDRGLLVDVDQSFGNCPRYIQVRTIDGIARGSVRARREGGSLSPRALEVLAAADTAFLASGGPPSRAGDGAHGCDVSHRGGRPGFMRATLVGGRTVVTMPDFAGNNFFMTLGNLAVRPRIGLAVVDFASGALLSVTGTSEIVWDGDELASFAGAERLVRVVVEEGALLEEAIPFVWSAPEPWPKLAATGSWGPR